MSKESSKVHKEREGTISPVSEKGCFIAKTWQNPYHEERNCEKNSGKSKTVPNMALNIQQLLERFRRGQAIPNHQTDDEIEKLRRMDTIEQIEYVQQKSEEAKKLYDELQQTRDNQNRERSEESSETAVDPKPRTAETEKSEAKGVRETKDSSSS